MILTRVTHETCFRISLQFQQNTATNLSLLSNPKTQRRGYPSTVDTGGLLDVGSVIVKLEAGLSVVTVCSWCVCVCVCVCESEAPIHLVAIYFCVCVCVCVCVCACTCMHTACVWAIHILGAQ